MERDPIKNDRRGARRERRLGEDAACILCGYRTPAGLRRVDRAFLEEHHLLGRVHDNALTAPLCLNCHAEVTEDQRLHGVDLESGAQLTPEQQVQAALLSLGPLLGRIGEALTANAYKLDQPATSPLPSEPERDLRDHRPAGLRRTEDGEATP